ncbi:MAG: M16 family metallopeptidase [Candidatus Sericytochromatia bacterium]
MRASRLLGATIALTLLLAPTGCASLKDRLTERPASARTVALPAPARVTLDNGLTLLVVERHNLPIVSVSAVVRAGEAYVPVGSAGLATLTAELLRRGTQGRSAPEIAEAIDFIGGSIESSAGLDSSSASLSVLKKDLDTGLALFSDVLLRPTFPDAELKRLKEEYRASLTASLDDADDVLRRAFQQQLLPGHPYGRQTTLSSLNGLTREAVQRFYQTYYRPNNTFMAVVGDITPAEAKARFERAFGGWKAQAVTAPSVPAPGRGGDRRVVFVEMPVNQSFIRLGNVAAARNTPDYFPLAVMNHILGGSFTSRLNQTLRDQQGLAYGAGSGLGMNLHGGTFFAGLNTKTESTDQAIKGLLGELERLQKERVSAEELAFAKDYLTGSFPLRFETNGDLAREVVNVEFFGLPEDYLATYRERVRAVTAEDIQRVAKQYLATDAYQLVVVGKAGVEDVLEGYGAVDELEKGALIQ